MAKVIVKNLATQQSKGTSVGEKRVRDTDGKVKTLRTLNAASKSFGSDLQYVFGKNVAKARRENKRITGLNDVVPTKR